MPEHGPDGIMAFFDSAANEIVLQKGLPADRERVCLLHEVLHACWFHLGLSERVEERIVTGLAPILLEVLRSNPSLVKTLLGRDT